jgi:hypothetical protein
VPTPTIFDEQRHYIDSLIRRRDGLKREARALLDAATRAGRTELEARQDRQFQAAMTDVKTLNARINDELEDLERMGENSPLFTRTTRGGTGSDAAAHSRQWSGEVANRLHMTFGEKRAIVSGSIDVPSLVLPYVVETPWPIRLIDLVVNRQVAQSNAFEYYQQIARTNNAAPVADLATKPTSVFTLDAHTDRCRVIAHLSQPVPYRYLQDAEQLQSWLVTEMYQGVMASLEAQIISGSGSGENMLGLLNTSGTTAVAFDTDAPTTIRHAQTELQLLGEVPNAIALHPSDAEAIDLTRWGSSGGLLTSGFQHPNTAGYGSSDNFFGPSDEIRRVVSPSVPQGTAIVADWSQIKIFVREDFTLLMNMYGDAEFSTNSYILRGEGRYGIGVLRPQSFAICDLTS